MRRVRHPARSPAGFTLVEILTALAVLSLLIVLVAQLLSGASAVTLLSRLGLDTDSEARLVFDRMGEDFTRMSRRPDVDFHFVKQTQNDTFFFFSEVPGYFAATEANPKSNLSLIGYRINSNYQLERLASGLTWDSDGTSNAPIFLTYASAPSDYTPTAASTILGLWPNVDQPSYTSVNFHVLGDSVFRLEFCFLLTDGTYSLTPALTPAVGANLTATRAPLGSDSATVGYRWYDTANFHAYVCTGGTAGATVWKPLGMTDVQAVVVGIALLNQTSRKLIAGNGALANLVPAFKDPIAGDLTGTPPTLMAQTWQTTFNQPGFATTVGLPVVVASQVRIYQRFFYLNNL